MSSYSKNGPPDIDQMLDAQATTREGPSFVVDAAAIQARIDARAKTPFRIKRGLFRVPREASERVKEATAKVAIGKWIRWNEQEGWSLKSNLTVQGPFPATDAHGNIPLLDSNEYRMQGAFRYAGRSPEPIRIELPKEGVKQSPDHRLTLQEAMQVWEVPDVDALQRQAAN